MRWFASEPRSDLHLEVIAWFREGRRGPVRASPETATLAKLVDGRVFDVEELFFCPQSHLSGQVLRAKDGES